MASVSYTSLAILILLGAAQGLFLSAYLLFRNENKKANRWLSFLLAAVSLHLLEYAADLSGVTLQYPFLLAITYPLLFCIGPLFLLYCRSLLDYRHKTAFRTVLHFLPSLGVLLAMLPFYIMPHQEKIGYINALANGNTVNIPIEQFLFMAAHIVQTVIYVLAARRFLHRKEIEFKSFSSDVFAAKKIEWLRTFALYFSIYLLLYFISVIILSAVDSFQIEIDYVMLLLTAAAIYAIGFKALSSPEIFKPGMYENHVNDRAESMPSPKFPELKEKLALYMETERPYLKNDLKISELANALSISSHQLSKLINDEFLVNFYDFINHYRVEEAKKLLRSNDHDFKILAIAYEVGFNSKATFNRVFKKLTDYTPSEFREKPGE